MQNAFAIEMGANEWERSAAHTSSAGYGDYWENLLWASEHQTQKDIQMYDMENVQLRREGRNFLFTVPGLAEGRPSVLRGDLVNISFGSCLYKGRVLTVRQLEVVLDMHTKFANNYNPGVDRVSVRFTFSRMTYRTSHMACGQLAEEQMGHLMLVPTREHIVEVMGRASNTPVQLAPWANRGLNPEQQAAVQRIVNASLKPLPYIIFGPPGTGSSFG